MTKNNENSDDNKGTDTSPTKTLSNTSIEQQLQQTFRYNREEMLALRDAKLSRTRPPELSRDFDSDKGLFSPDKWVQYKWQCEGIEPRRRRQHIIPVSGANAYPIGSKTLSSILESTIAATKNDDLLDNHNTMLSPQRRGFSSGCKAASPPKSDNKSHHQQQQSSSGRSRWQIKNNGSDFKPAFQKNALEASSRSSRSGSSQNNTSIGGKDGINNSSWNNSGHKHGDKNRRSGERERTRSTTTETDQVPEWVAAGPTSVFDVIELKGFDDEEEEQTANEKKRRRSRGRKDSIGNNNLKSNSETSAVCQKSSSFRQKRQSSEDITSNKSQNNIHNISRPSSHKTPQQSDSFYSSHSPVKVIMASDLESSILREHAEKLEKEKASILSDESNKTFDLLAALGIQPSNNKDVVGDKTISETKLPNSDAEFAACILGLPIDQIAKIMPNMLPSVNTEPQQQQDQPTTSRLIRWQKATLNAAKSENNLSRIGDEELKMALKRDLMVNDDSRMNKTLLPPRGQFIPNGQQPFVFNPPIGGPYGGGNQFQGGVHHFQNVGPSHHNNFVLPPYGAVPFTSSQQQFFPPFGSSTGLNHPNYNQNRQQSPFNPMNNQLHFPPPLVNPQQQMSAHHQNLLNSPAFMPTSVMRQMSKMPGCGSSVNSGGESPSGGGGGGSTTNISAAGLGPNNTSALLQKMFAEPVMFNPAIGGPYGGGSPFPGGGHHFQNVGPSHHSNFALPPYAMPFTPNQQFFHPFGSSSGLTHSNYNQNRQQSPFNAMNAPMNFPPPLVNPQQQMSAHHQNLINSPAFMPTSVMRQMSKMPGCGSSVNSGGDSTSVGGATLAAAATGLSSSNTSALLQKMFAEAKRNESQQQQTQSTGRAILGCDPNLEIGFLSPTEAQGSNPS